MKNVALLGSCLITLSLGSIHAFSVFLNPLETVLGQSRAWISSIYSLALVCLTLAVLIGHRVYSRTTLPKLIFGIFVIAALGLLLSAFSRSIWGYWIGYSLLFGGANGFGYGLSLVVTSQAMPERAGFGLGTVTAMYALGAAIFVKLFESLLLNFNLTVLFVMMGAILLLVGGLCAWFYAQLDFQRIKELEASEDDDQISQSNSENQLLIGQIWLGYGLAVFAGLMAIGHAAGIVLAAGGASRQVVLGVVVVGIGNAAGGFIAGWLIDRIDQRLILICLSALSSLILALMVFIDGSPLLTIIGLSLIGLTYGAIIAVIPVVSLAYFGSQSTKVYGRIFTAWGTAGLLGPWFAGFIFDRSGGYFYALAVASVLAFVSILIYWRLPSPSPPVST